LIGLPGSGKVSENLVVVVCQFGAQISGDFPAVFDSWFYKGHTGLSSAAEFQCCAMVIAFASPIPLVSLFPERAFA